MFKKIFHIAKSFAKSPFCTSKRIIHKIRDILFPNRTVGTVFMLHRVSKWCIDSGGGALFPNENMKLTPAKLQEVIDSVKKTHNIISSTEINQYIKKRHKKPFCVFSLDDGYKDNFTNAYPIFKENNVPFTIFLVADFANQRSVMWWYELEDLILANTSIHLADGSDYECVTQAQKDEVFLAIRLKILELDQENLENELNALFDRYKINWHSKCTSLCLNWQDVEKLKSDKLCTIGAHSEHHYNLKALATSQEVIDEIEEGLNTLKAHGITPSVFAYPFGSPNEVGERELEILSKMNFRNAFLAYGGNVKSRDYKYFAVPRIMLTQQWHE